MDGLEVVAVCRRLAEWGLIGATEGNVSVRLGEDRFLTTPSGSRKDGLRPFELVVVDAAGRVIAGTRAPSTELKMHLAIYQARPDVRAVVHAHPLTAVALTVAGLSLMTPAMPEAELYLGGGISTAPYSPPGSAELAEGAVVALGARHGCLLERHGAVTVGPTLTEACDRMEVIERLARVEALARLL